MASSEQVGIEKGLVEGCPIVNECEKVVGECLAVVDEPDCFLKNEPLSFFVEQEMEKVSLVEHSSSVASLEENGVQNEMESEDASSSSSEDNDSEDSDDSDSEDSDGSDSDDELEEKVKEEVDDAEEGEIRDDEHDIEKMVSWSDLDDEDLNGATKVPIKSKNELEDLPPVPSVDVTLHPSHQLLPVGAVISILGARVVVEGVEKHNPLNEGSVIWITERRSPLGLIDELFGPVKNPYYVVRYNSDSEVPTGIHEGTLISFVPEFAIHVLNDKNLYKKGYDASGENDEEISDAAEFSDDEKEAEYKRMLKMTKRGTNDQKPVSITKNRKKVKNGNRNWKESKQSPQQTGIERTTPNQNHDHILPIPSSLPLDNSSSSFNMSDGFAGGNCIPPFSQTVHTAGAIPPSGVWMNGMPFQQSQNAFFANGFLNQGMPWLSHGQIPMPMPNGMMFGQQFNPTQRPPILQGPPSNYFTGPTPSDWPPVLVGQNGFIPNVGMGLQVQHTHPTGNMGGQGNLNNGLHAGQNSNFQPPANGQGSNEATQKFNLGTSTNYVRKPNGRGGGGQYRRGGRHN